MGRIYQNEYVIMKELGLIQEVEVIVVSKETFVLEGTPKEIAKELADISEDEDVLDIYYKVI